MGYGLDTFLHRLGLVRAVALASTFLLTIASDASHVCAGSIPNIVIFLVDDMGVMDSSVPFLTDAKGKPRRYPLNEYYRTPNLMGLSERGMRFSDFQAMSVCSPSRISLLTGQYSARHRTTNWIDPASDNTGPQGPADWNWKGLRTTDVTLVKILKELGYRTIHVGKGHFGPTESEAANPTNLGFDVNIGGDAFGSPATYYGQANYGNAGGDRKGSSPHAVPHLGKYHGTTTFLTEALTIEAKAQISMAVEANQPFFLHFAHYAAHAPFESDPRFAANYSGSGKSPEAQAFATLIEGIDQSLGDLIHHLDDLNVAEDTLIFFLGDNGTDAPLGHEHAVACAEPLRGKKGSHYEGGTRVPFVAAWAKSDPNRACQSRLPICAGGLQPQLASVCDLYPTILYLLDVSPPPNHVIDGSSLHVLLSGRSDPDRKDAFLVHYPHEPHRSNYWSSFRKGKWKLVYHYFPSEASGSVRYELFNLADDPSEQDNLAESCPEELQRMLRDLSETLEACDAVYPKNAILLPKFNK